MKQQMVTFTRRNGTCFNEMWEGNNPQTFMKWVINFGQIHDELHMDTEFEIVSFELRYQFE